MLGFDTITVDLMALGEQVEGIERSTGREKPYWESAVMRLVHSSTQKLAVRQAGEMKESLWTGYLDPPAVGRRWPEPGDVVLTKTACYANSPVSAWEGWRFEITDVAATATEIRLSLTAVDR